MNRGKVTAAQRREHPEPQEIGNPIPWSVIVLVVLLSSICIAYIVQANVNTPSDWGDGRTVAELSNVGGNSPGAKPDGNAIFAASCAACHQATGAGLPGVFPPLAGSEWVMGKDTTVAAIVLNGITGPITVKGSDYVGAMPAFREQFSDAQLAAVLGHVRSQWGNAAPAVTASTVAQVREQLKAQARPFTGGRELEALSVPPSR